MYAVKEIYRTIQGEGFNTGTPAIFLRFSGCNLWNGKEEDRHKGKGDCAKWCDTSFFGTDGENGGHYNADALAQKVRDLCPYEPRDALVVCTGGEPLLQLNPGLIAKLHQQGFRIAIETNGTILAPPGIDHICVSPKGNATLVQKQGDELKLIYPTLDPETYLGLRFDHFFLQPLSNLPENIQATVAYVMNHPPWRLSLQTHKIIGLP